MMIDLKPLIKRIRSASWESCDRATRDALKLTLIDSLGALVFGNNTPENRALQEKRKGWEDGPFAVLGTTVSLSAKEAAFLNGCGSVATEMDEGHQWSKGHPGAHVIPTLLTRVQGRSVPGRKFLEYLLASYEVSSRFGRAVTLNPQAHGHGGWGVAGAAAAAMLLAGSDDEAFAEGLLMSASFALPTMWTAALEGALVRNAYMGHCAEAAIALPEMVEAGFTAPRDNLTYVFSEALGKKLDTLPLEKDYGKWEIMDNYFKPYAFCRYSHAPIDAMKEILEKNGVSPDDIISIKVETYSRAAGLCSTDPKNVLAAKFSIPYALGILCYGGEPDQDCFAPHLFEDTRVRKIASLTEVTATEECEKNYPTEMLAYVTVTTTEGKEFRRSCSIAKGGPGVPLSIEEIEEKFRQLTKSVYTQKRQEEILQFIWNLEEEEDMLSLIQLCSPDRSEDA